MSGSLIKKHLNEILRFLSKFFLFYTIIGDWAANLNSAPGHPTEKSQGPFHRGFPICPERLRPPRGRHFRFSTHPLHTQILQLLTNSQGSHLQAKSVNHSLLLSRPSRKQNSPWRLSTHHRHGTLRRGLHRRAQERVLCLQSWLAWRHQNLWWSGLRGGILSVAGELIPCDIL